MADLKVALAVDADNPDVNDLFLENGTIRLTASLLEVVAQRIFICLKMFKGEWFLDPTQGIPYWQSILGQKTPLPVVSRIFRMAVQQQPGIRTIDKFTVIPKPNRALQLDFACTLNDGAVLRSSDFAPFIVGGA